MTHATVNDEFTLELATKAKVMAITVDALLAQAESLLSQIELNTDADVPFNEIEGARAKTQIVIDDLDEAIDRFCGIDSGDYVEKVA